MGQISNLTADFTWLQGHNAGGSMRWQIDTPDGKAGDAAAVSEVIRPHRGHLDARVTRLSGALPASTTCLRKDSPLSCPSWIRPQIWRHQELAGNRQRHRRGAAGRPVVQPNLAADGAGRVDQGPTMTA